MSRNRTMEKTRENALQQQRQQRWDSSVYHRLFRGRSHITYESVPESFRFSFFSSFRLQTPMFFFSKHLKSFFCCKLHHLFLFCRCFCYCHWASGVGAFVCVSAFTTSITTTTTTATTTPSIAQKLLWLLFLLLLLLSSIWKWNECITHVISNSGPVRYVAPISRASMIDCNIREWLPSKSSAHWFNVDTATVTLRPIFMLVDVDWDVDVDVYVCDVLFIVCRRRCRCRHTRPLSHTLQ